MDFYHCSNTHDPDQDRFEDLYCADFIHAISCVAYRKLACHRLDPYQRAAFCCGIVCHNTGKEEVNSTLELAMEYAGALGTIIFDESCHLRDLTEVQIGRNQFAIDVAMDRLDREATGGRGGITQCHRHGRLARLSLDSFFIFAKSNSSFTLVDLIFLLVLSIHVTSILSYLHIFMFIPTRSLSFLQMRWLLL